MRLSRSWTTPHAWRWQTRPTAGSPAATMSVRCTGCRLRSRISKRRLDFRARADRSSTKMTGRWKTPSSSSGCAAPGPFRSARRTFPNSAWARTPITRCTAPRATPTTCRRAPADRAVARAPPSPPDCFRLLTAAISAAPCAIRATSIMWLASAPPLDSCRSPRRRCHSSAFCRKGRWPGAWATRPCSSASWRVRIPAIRHAIRRTRRGLRRR
jgi:hypothetical protein